ncbi:MAG: FadR/GntR family transcriptional regulator [bacterium]
MFEPKPVQSEKAYVQVVNQIRQYILDGKLKPGDKLPPERILADMFGTSRPPIREALSALEVMGYVESRTGYGTIVTEVPIESTSISQIAGQSSPYEVMEARLVLEPEITRMACLQAKQGDLDAMEEVLERLRIAEMASDYDSYNQCDADFHLAIAKATHNELLYRVGVLISLGMKEQLWKALKTTSLKIPENIRRYTKEHEEIYQCVKTKDSVRVIKVIYDHIKSVDKDVFGQ